MGRGIYDYRIVRDETIEAGGRKMGVVEYWHIHIDEMRFECLVKHNEDNLSMTQEIELGDVPEEVFEELSRQMDEKKQSHHETITEKQEAIQEIEENQKEIRGLIEGEQ